MFIFYTAAPRFPASIVSSLELVEGEARTLNFSARANPEVVTYAWKMADGSDAAFADGITLQAVSG